MKRSNRRALKAFSVPWTPVLGDDFSRPVFEREYAELNRAKYHPVTEDNQDYLAYICLVINAGLIGLDEVDQEVATDSFDNFEQFMRWVDSRMMIRPARR